MLLAIDIGNSTIKVGFFENEELTAHFSLKCDPGRTADEYAFLIKSLSEKEDLQRVDGVILGSVVPSLTKTVAQAVAKLTDGEILTVGPGLKTGFPLKIDDPRELGADLAANAAGALEAIGFPALVADFGTATTLQVIDEKGAYRGGCFLPGIGMSLEALGGAELLPEIPAEPVPSPLGTNTKDCMRAGVLRGQAFSVIGFAKTYKTRLDLPQDTPLIITGGYAPLIHPCLPDGTAHVPLLTLKGLCAIYHFNKRARKS